MLLFFLFQAFLFYGSDVNLTDLPVPQKQEIWALFHEESLKNAPFLLSEQFMSLFNFTSTFDRESDLPLTTLHLSSLNAITGINQSYKILLQLVDFLKLKLFLMRIRLKLFKIIRFYVARV